MKRPSVLTRAIDEKTWAQFCNKLPNPEAQKVLYEVIEYVTTRLKSRIHKIERLAEHTPELKYLDSICFLSQGKTFLTINVTRKGLRIYFYPTAGVFLDAKEKYAVEAMSYWQTNYHKKTGKYRGFTAWVSKEIHLSGIKKLIDMIPE